MNLVHWLAAALVLSTSVAATAQSTIDDAEAAPSAVTVTLEPTTVTVGDRLTARITLVSDAPLDGPPRFPVWEGHWGDAEILAVEPPVDQGDGVWTQKLDLAVFQTGIATLPGITIEIPSSNATSQASCEATTVQVDSVLPESQEEVAPLPPEPVRALPVGRPFWWALALLGLGFLLLAYVVLQAARRARAAVAALSMSPLEAFRVALGRLRDERGVLHVYTELSLELRRYIGRSLGFPAAEGTTTQIQRSLRERQLPPELVSETLGLLREADQIKFARGEANRERVSRRLDDADRLVEGIESWLAPVVEAPAAGKSEAAA